MNDFNLQQLQDRLVPQLWELLMQAAAVAQKQGWQLYLVGGAVRDLLLAQPETSNLSIEDIDLAVDGSERIVDAGAGVELAKTIQQLYPAARLDVHGTFQTAALHWDNDVRLGSLSIDLATARTESYPYPAANPIVAASSIREDLYRRDFTINAMALRLTSDRSTSASQTGILLDLYGGLADLQAKQLRVLHPESFIEDPTRIFRGARFAARLGFQFEPQTDRYFRAAIASGIYQQTAKAHPKTPALQSRLKTELKYLLQADYWLSALELLDRLGALQCIHPTLALNPALIYQLRRIKGDLREFDPDRESGWQLGLEAILAQLAPTDRQPVAQNLQLSIASCSRLANLAAAESALTNMLPTYNRTSQKVGLLKQYDRATLILILVRSEPEPISLQILIYLKVWAQIQPLLTGNDLRELGYKPSPQFRHILDELTIATLDGEVVDRSTAIALVSRFTQKLTE